MSQSAALRPPNRAERRSMQKRARRQHGPAMARDLLTAATPEFLISNKMGEELEFDAARECTEARLIREFLQLNVDPRFDVIYAKPGATTLRGGYWHIIFRNDSGMPNIWEVCSLDGKGEPCYPTMEHVRRIQQTDLNHRNVWDDYQREKAAAARRKEKDAEAKHEEFREKLLERLEHLYRVQIHLPAGIKERLEAEAIATSERLVEAGEAALPEPPTGEEASVGAAASPCTVEGGEDVPPSAQRAGTLTDSSPEVKEAA